jgi:hypothetical protein
LNGQKMEYINLTLVDGTSILQSYCFMQHPSTCSMYVTMLPRVIMIHIIHVLCTIHMSHIVEWEQIVLMGHVGHVLRIRMRNVGHLLQMVHMSPICKWFTYKWTFQMNINIC